MIAEWLVGGLSECPSTDPAVGDDSWGAAAADVATASMA